jgi:dienelactone hydrolase
VRLLPLAALLACSGPEPIVLPDDPAASGAPVGVTTIRLGRTDAEVWYPAADAAEGEPQEPLGVLRWVPQVVQDRLGTLDLADPPTGAVRDARLRRPQAPYPVVIFSHGFGGMRYQSFDLTVHLASRGFVVISADHRGRNLADQLPCVFSPVLDGCNLGLGQDDPAPPDIEAALAWAESANAEGVFAGALDLDALGLFGHSAGGGSTSRVGSEDQRFKALMPLGGGAVVTRDVPTAFISATCDGIIAHERLVEVADASVDATMIALHGGGHLAFSDLCLLELGRIAEEVLAPRDDINNLILSQLTRLATDGCPGFVPDPPPSDDCADGYLPLDVSAPINRHYVTAFFEAELAARGPGIQAGVFAEATVQ